MIRYVFLGILILAGFAGFLVVALVESTWPVFIAYFVFFGLGILLYGIAFGESKPPAEAAEAERDEP